MKLTRSVGYAVGILLQIQQGRGSAPLTAARIARGCKFPPRFLYRVLRRLVDAGLLGGTSGPGGGYSLAQSPNEITMLDIVTAVEDVPEAGTLEAVCNRHREAFEKINRLCIESARQFTDSLSTLTLADLVTPPGRPKKKAAKKARPGKRATKKRAAKKSAARR